MSVVLVGGMDRLESHYVEEARRLGIKLKVFTHRKRGISPTIGNVDAVVVFTNKVSHRARRDVMHAARAKKVPVLMYHSCGVCTLRNCLKCLRNMKGG